MAVAKLANGAWLHLFTVDDYMKMDEVGILTADDHVELIEGVIRDMSPIKPLHASLVDTMNLFLHKRIGHQVRIRVQSPIHLNQYNMPQPDLAIIKPRKNQYRDHHPQAADVFIVIEVSDSTLEFDQKVKIPLYAASSIPEYWIIDANKQTLEQHTQPTAQSYATHVTLKADDTIKTAQITDFELTINQIFNLDSAE